VDRSHALPRMVEDQVAGSQALTLSWLASTHSWRRVRGHLVLGDVPGHQVLVLVGPLELLDQLVGRPRVGDFFADDLVQVRSPG